MKSRNPIGGFFSLENIGETTFDHQNPRADDLALTNGRACISAIIELQKPKKIFIPYYTCYALIEPLLSYNISYEFYEIDSMFKPIHLPNLKKNELFILINYFGQLTKYAKKLEKDYGRQLVIDETHNFFYKKYAIAFAFTSARKYFGVPDGAYLSGISEKEKEMFLNLKSRFKDVSYSHLIQGKLGLQECAYRSFISYEKSLGFFPHIISEDSEFLMKHIPFNNYKNLRLKNFGLYQNELSKYNQLEKTNKLEIGCYSYPFMVKEPIDLSRFHSEKIFIPILWPDILNRENNYKYKKSVQFVKCILPLPIDQRIGKKSLRKVINKIKEVVNEK